MVRRLRSSDTGVFAVLYALLVVMLCMVAALVVDVGGLRMDRRYERLASDAGATAGASYLNPSDPESARDACRNAFEYVMANLDDAGTTFTRPNCAALSGVCTATSPAISVAGTVGRYTVTITYPVPDNSALMHPDVAPGYAVASQPLNPSFDGLPCQRLGVAVAGHRKFVLAPAGGFVGTDTSVHSVARSDVYQGGSVVAPLVVLDPYHCNSLVTTGQGDIRVLNNGDLPGVIAVDSDATKDLNPLRCDSPNQYVIDSGNGNGRILAYPGASGAPPFIYSYALYGSRADHAFDPGDVVPACQPTSSIPGTSGKLCPQPTAMKERITRTPWDDRYGAFVSSMRALYDNVASPSTPPATGTWTTIPSTDNLCKNNPPNRIFTAGNYFFNCTPTVKNAIWRFLPGSTVVFEGNVTSATGGCIYFNATDTTTDQNLPCPTGAVTDPSSDMVVYIRRGGSAPGDKGILSKDSDGSFIAARTAVIQSGDDSTPDVGHFNLNGGTGRIYWTALRDSASPTRSGLAYWSEGRSYPHDGEAAGITSPHNLGGQSNVTLTGVMFMPNAQVSFSGQTGDAQFAAQFVAYRVNNAGQSSIKLVPDISNAVPVPIVGVDLIR